MTILGNSVLDAVPCGIALVDATGTPLWINRAGRAILGDSAESRSVVGLFPVVTTSADRRIEETREWTDATGRRVALSYQAGAQLADGRVVLFEDVTDRRDHQLQVAALARTAASMASDNSLEKVLEAMAEEVWASEGIAGTQIVTRAADSDDLQLMGSAGFHHEVTTFFGLLMESNARGAELVTTRTMTEGRQFVLPARRAQMLADPDWAPLHDYVSQIDWDDFVSSPLISRRGVVGVLNVYVKPSHAVNSSMLGFLQSMADQAALAVDYATLMSIERVTVRTDERRRLARDLHDSVIQHVFSIGMQAKGLSLAATRLPEAHAQQVGRMSAEISELAGNVRRDLRGIVLALQPPVSAEMGLVAALTEFADGIMRRDAIHISLDVDPELDADLLDDSLVEDLYLLVSEAVHNSVKHADPTAIEISLGYDSQDRRIFLEVRDDGNGPVEPGEHRELRDRGHGLASMHDRAARWDGEMTLAPNGTSGTIVRATLSVPDRLA